MSARFIGKSVRTAARRRPAAAAAAQRGERFA